MTRKPFPVLKIMCRLALLFVFGFNLSSCTQDTPKANNKSQVLLKIGLPPYIADFYGLLFIADTQGFFTEQGLKISFIRMESGPDAMRAVLKGEIDMAGGTEFPFSQEILRNKDLKVITTVWHGESVYIAGRKDRGIHGPSDFRGKKVAVALGTQLNFFLERYLLYQGLTTKDVDILDTNLHSLLNTFLSGKADGVVFVEPDLDKAKMKFGDIIAAWPIQDEQPTYALMACTGGYTKSHPKVIKRFLQALLTSERYYHRNPKRALAQILDHPARKESPYGKRLPTISSYGLLLDKTFLVMLEDESRWRINEANDKTRKTPNFLRHIYFKGLETVYPQGISIVR